MPRLVDTMTRGDCLRQDLTPRRLQIKRSAPPPQILVDRGAFAGSEPPRPGDRVTRPPS